MFILLCFAFLVYNGKIDGFSSLILVSIFGALELLAEIALLVSLLGLS